MTHHRPLAHGLRSLWLKFVAIVLLVSLAQPPTAQELMEWDERWFDRFFSVMRVDEITDSPHSVVVRASRMLGEGRIMLMDPVTCLRGSEADSLAIFDSVLKTDDRQSLRPGTCDQLLAAARRRKAAQER